MTALSVLTVLFFIFVVFVLLFSSSSHPLVEPHRSLSRSHGLRHFHNSHFFLLDVLSASPVISNGSFEIKKIKCLWWQGGIDGLLAV